LVADDYLREVLAALQRASEKGVEERSTLAKTVADLGTELRDSIHNIEVDVRNVSVLFRGNGNEPVLTTIKRHETRLNFIWGGLAVIGGGGALVAIIFKMMGG
jgi:hypothetical protein